MLFLTKFTGKGLWYIFLGTMVFASLWDQETCPKVLGACLSIYPILLGLAAFFKGWCLSLELNKVRKQKLNKGLFTPSSSLLKEAGLSLTHFKTELNEYDGNPAPGQGKSGRKGKFSDTDLMYIMRGLSSDPDPIMDPHKITIKADDLDHWKSRGTGKTDMSW